MGFLSTLLVITVIAVAVVDGSRVSPVSFAPLSVDKMRELSLITMSNFHRYTRDLAVVRVSGTDEIARIRRYINDSIDALNWNVEMVPFVVDTPIGEKEMANIVVSWRSKTSSPSPSPERMVVVAAHYDSKLFLGEGAGFVGATDR